MLIESMGAYRLNWRSGDLGSNPGQDNHVLFLENTLFKLTLEKKISLAKC